jgi:hypothetical protein
MNLLRRRSSPYVIAAIGSIAILTYLPLFIFSVLIFPASHSIGGPLMVLLYIENPFVILHANLIVAGLSTPVFFIPLSILLDWSIQKANQGGERRKYSFLLSAGLWAAVLILVVGSFTLAFGSFFENPSILRVFGEQSVDSHIASQAQTWSLWFLFLGGIPLVLGGVVYWLLLQMSRRMLSQRRDPQEERESPSVRVKTRPPEAPPTKSQWKFLVQWSALNVLGWAVGVVFFGFTLFRLQSFAILRPMIDHPAVRVTLLCLLPGAVLGMLQWVIVRKFGINPFKWTILTALGLGIGFGIWVLLYFAVEHPAWVFSLDGPPFGIPLSTLLVIRLGLIGAVLIGGAVLAGAAIGSFQSILLRRFISRPGSWTRAYILGFLIPAILASLIYLLKSFLKKILFSLPFLSVEFSSEIIHMRWTLVFRFCLLAAILGISILTGWVLLIQTNIVQNHNPGRLDTD